MTQTEAALILDYIAASSAHIDSQASEIDTFRKRASDAQVRVAAAADALVEAGIYPEDRREKLAQVLADHGQALALFEKLATRLSGPASDVGRVQPGTPATPPSGPSGLSQADRELYARYGIPVG